MVEWRKKWVLVICFAFGMSLFIRVGGKSIGESADTTGLMRGNCQLSLWGQRTHNNHVATVNGYDVSQCSTAFASSHYCPGTSKEQKKTRSTNDALRLLYTPMVGHETRRVSLLHMSNNNVEDDDDQKEGDDSLQVRSKKEWIDGKKMMQILAQEKAEEQRRKKEEEVYEVFNIGTETKVESSFSGPFVDIIEQNKQLVQRNSLQTSEQKEQSPSKLDSFVSRISYTDANTLEIEMPPSGLDANTVSSGVFSALWFSAVAPATVSMLSAGIAPVLFMAPFWLAGGVVAKTAVYDPFVSSTLSIGQYLWTLEKNYLKRVGILSRKRKEGSTENLKGASVELAMVVNNVGRYHLRLLVDGNSPITFGKGLPQEELEYLSRVINDHCLKLREESSS